MGNILLLYCLVALVALGVGSCGNRKADKSGFQPGLDTDSLKVSTEIPEIPEADSYYKFDGPDEAVRFMKESGHWEQYERGILPQMAVDVFDYAEKLLNSKYDGFVVVDKRRMKVIVFNRYGVEVESFGMACAKSFGTKHKMSDSRTPEGFFSVNKIHNSTDWHFIDDNGVRSEKTGEYGPRFIRLNIPVTTQIGIHGTSAPWSIGARVSHGCIRIKNENIMKLVEMVDSGMPVIVTPGSKDMAVNIEEGFDIPSISTVPGKPHLTVSDIRVKESLADNHVSHIPDTMAYAIADSVSGVNDLPLDTIAKKHEIESGTEVAKDSISEFAEVERISLVSTVPFDCCDLLLFSK